jgi:hypothetical protein
MENVTGKWRFRDGRDVVAVYRDGNTLLGIWNHSFVSHFADSWKHSQNGSDLIPVEPEPVYRPFRDLKEAFAVMGPMPWIRENGLNYWMPFQAVFPDGFVQFRAKRFTMLEAFESLQWTNDPSDETGEPCGVEVTP